MMKSPNIFCIERDCSPCDEIQVIWGDDISSLFLLPEEIEDILEWEGEIIPIKVLRKLHSFRYYFWEKLESIEQNITQDDITRTLKMITIRGILDIFRISTCHDFEKNLRKYTVYFLAVEAYYEEEKGEPLSFRGLDEPNEYNDYLWF